MCIMMTLAELSKQSLVEYRNVSYYEPLFFLLYINDIINVSYLLFSIVFADDTSVFIYEIAWDNIINETNCEYNIVV